MRKILLTTKKLQEYLVDSHFKTRCNNMTYSKEQICKALDLAVLKPTATVHDVAIAAELVEQHHIATICVAPINVRTAKKITKRVACVVGFPHGQHLQTTKLHESKEAIDGGAIELDVVINYGRFLDGCPSIVVNELDLLMNYAIDSGVRVKAILETCYYTEDQLHEVCRICTDAGVDWVKTSTGFAAEGATPGKTQTMLDAVRGKAQVKASGGIKTYEDAALYLDLGCTRIGSSKFWELLNE